MCVFARDFSDDFSGGGGDDNRASASDDFRRLFPTSFDSETLCFRFRLDVGDTIAEE